MKILGSIITPVLVCLTTHAQGTVNFASTGAQAFYCAPYKGGAALPTGLFTVGLYYGVAGTTDPATLSLLKTTTIGPLAGRFLGGTVTTPATTAPGASAVFEIRVWTSGFASYEAAVGSGDPSVEFGTSGLFNNPTGGGGSPPGPPQSLVTSSVLVCPIPEPSTVGLGLLGAVLFLSRRRKDP